MSDVLRPVQIIPPGFLGALQLKSRGQAPDEVRGDYQPTIDMRDWLLMQNNEQVGGTTAAPGAGFVRTTLLIVPSNQWWVIWEANLKIVCGAAATRCTLDLGLNDPTSGLDCSIVQPFNGMVAAGAHAGALRSVSRASGSPAWAPPGTLLVAATDSDVAFAGTFLFLMRITRLSPI